MAASLKTNGLREVEALRKRVRRQFAMERISGQDAEILLDHINKIEAHIISMREEGPDHDD